MEFVDVAPSAVAGARRLYPGSAVDYRVADMTDDEVLSGASFDLVVEVYTFQVLPADLRPVLARNLARLVAPGGTLLVVARGREPEEDPGSLPWPVTRAEIEACADFGLELCEWRDFGDDEEPPVRRFLAQFRRP